MKKKEERKNTLKQKLLGLNFYHSPQSNLLQFNKIVIGNFKLKGLRPEKLPFDSLFSSESYVFPMGFLCVLKIYQLKFLIVEKMGVWNGF